MPLYKDILNGLMMDVNAKNFDNFGDYFHEQGRVTVFVLKLGTFTTVQGIPSIKEAFQRTFGYGDAQLSFSNLIVEENKLAFSGNITGTQFYSISNQIQTDPYIIKIMGYCDIIDNKIVYMDYLTHTFEVMRLTGVATFQFGNKEQIQEYLTMLVKLNIIPDKIHVDVLT